MRAVVETEAHVAAQGWDGPARVFSLVRTAQALALDPQLAGVLCASAVAQARQDTQALTVIEQENLPAATDLEDLLAQLAWPKSVHGAAISVERLMLPPSAQQQALEIQDPQALQAFLATHREREDVRIVVGVLRGGEAWCAVRTRSHDEAGEVYQGAALVPGLVEALAATLS